MSHRKTLHSSLHLCRLILRDAGILRLITMSSFTRVSQHRPGQHHRHDDILTCSNDREAIRSKTRRAILDAQIVAKHSNTKATPIYPIYHSPPVHQDLDNIAVHAHKASSPSPCQRQQSPNTYIPFPPPPPRPRHSRSFHSATSQSELPLPPTAASDPLLRRKFSHDTFATTSYHAVPNTQPLLLHKRLPRLPDTYAEDRLTAMNFPSRPTYPTIQTSASTVESLLSTRSFSRDSNSINEAAPLSMEDKKKQKKKTMHAAAAHSPIDLQLDTCHDSYYHQLKVLVSDEPQSPDFSPISISHHTEPPPRKSPLKGMMIRKQPRSAPNLRGRCSCSSALGPLHHHLGAAAAASAGCLLDSPSSSSSFPPPVHQQTITTIGPTPLRSEFEDDSDDGRPPRQWRTFKEFWNSIKKKRITFRRSV
jgi:hypothetical protein